MENREALSLEAIGCPNANDELALFGRQHSGPGLWSLLDPNDSSQGREELDVDGRPDVGRIEKILAQTANDVLVG